MIPEELLLLFTHMHSHFTIDSNFGVYRAQANKLCTWQIKSKLRPAPPLPPDSLCASYQHDSLVPICCCLKKKPCVGL